MRTILLTGASGFVGARLANALKRRGNRLILLQRTGSALPNGNEIVEIDEFEPAVISAALSARQFDLTVHLAAAGVKPEDRDPAALFRVNVAATQALIEASAKCGAKSFVCAGSSAEYGESAQVPLDPDQPLESRRLYGASKAIATLMTTSLASALGMAGVSLRLFNAYGPGEAPHRLLPSLVRALSSGLPAHLSLGLQQRDFIHIDDVCAAFVAAIERAPEIDGSIIDICTGTPSTVRKFAETVAEAMGADQDLLRFGATPMRTDEIMALYGNPEQMIERLGIGRPRSLDDGIAQAVHELSARRRDGHSD